MASARQAFITLAEKTTQATFPNGPKETDMQESKKGTIFASVFEIGGFMPEMVSTITLGGKAYDISMKLQISIKRSGTGGAKTHRDVDIK